MKIVHEQILFDCLEQFEAGVPVARLKDIYPNEAEEIENFLMVASQLEHVPVQPSLAAKQRSQKLFLQHAAKLRHEKRKYWFSWPAMQRKLLPLASMAMVTILVGITFLFASSSAIPGDVLYDTKRWVETMQLEQAIDATAVFSLNRQQNTERVREVQSLLRTNETADISFEGIINTKQGTNWIVGGLAVQVTRQTVVDDGAVKGALVLVNGRTHNGHLYADQIIVLNQITNTALPTNTAVSTAEPTQTNTQTPEETVEGTIEATTTQAATPVTPATNTPTITAPVDNTATPGATATSANETPTITTTAPSVTVTNSPEPTLSATPKATETPEPTSEPTAVPPTPTNQPEPTSTPTPGDDNNNDNGGGNDNDNDNGGNDNDNDNGGNDNDNDNDGDNDNDNDNGDRDSSD